MAEKKEDNEIGFAGIGKRIENLNNNDLDIKDTDWKQKVKTEIPRQTNTDSTNKQEPPPKIYKQRIGLPFKLSFAKVFWGIVVIVIIVSIFSQNNYKKKADDNFSSTSESSSQPKPSKQAVRQHWRIRK